MPPYRFVVAASLSRSDALGQLPTQREVVLAVALEFVACGIEAARESCHGWYPVSPLAKR
jgi:hypothetical protein